LKKISVTTKTISGYGEYLQVMEGSFAAILLMGGKGERLGSDLPKQFRPLGPKKIYQHTLDRITASGIFQQIVLVCHPAWVEEVQREVPASTIVIEGGPTRQASSFLGLNACSPLTKYVMIHDGVRPFVSHAILEKNRAAVLKHNAVNTCIPSADTLVQHQEEFITAIPIRRHFLRGQTPQTFAYPLIVEAHRQTKQMDATDDCSLVLEQGHRVAVVRGEEENIKITTEWDLQLAQWLYANK
jgi:ribitol-5-phosphate 2-dehydrogenase (NADP+) / D-ribitol-5-phosphate cytidylyltransferase